MSTDHVFEDEGEGFPGVDDVVEGDDVGVFELLEERGLPDCGERRPLLFLQTDFLQRHRLPSQTKKVQNVFIFKPKFI